MSESTSDNTSHQPDYASVDSALTGWWQGDTVSGVPVSWFADGENPLTPEGAQVAARTSADDYLVPVEVLPTSVAIVTQTCDLARSCDPENGQPLIQVSPVVDLAESEDLANAQGGHSPHFAPLPALGETVFVDLRKCTTVEKAVLKKFAHTRLPGCESDLHRAAFSRAVARQRGRFAFPDELTRALKPLQNRLRTKRKKNSAEARRISDVVQIRVNCLNGEWFAADIQVELVFLVESLPPSKDEPEQVSGPTAEFLAGQPAINDLATYIDSDLPPADLVAAWSVLASMWSDLCEPSETVTTLEGRAESPSEFTIAEAWRMPRLDLDHLSDEAQEAEAARAG